ncbi:porin [Azohydromonas australica]|uniref:porin n=1 Tax=Azohydromonas australica TaxID=364039 RepID=UPI0004233852|nr:porin [Azohydromonas australica]
MKKTMAAALALTAAAVPAMAQSNVRIYGVLDVMVEHLRANNGVNLTRMAQTGHVPSRFGFEGTEDLGGGLKAEFTLEGGIGVDTGSSLQGGRLFGRQAFVGLRSERLGTVRFGRQYSVMQSALVSYDPDYFSPYSPGLAMQLANIDQTVLDNVISYISPRIGGFTGTLAFAPGEGASVTPATPQFIAAGTAASMKAAMLQYAQGNFSAGVAYQARGETLAAGGAKVEPRIMSIGAKYALTPTVELGALYWVHRNELPSGAAPTTRVATIGVNWKATSAVTLVAQVGHARDDGRVYATGAAKARGTNDYLNLGATYHLSKRTAVYTRYGRVSDEDSGFNGRPSQAMVSIRDGVALPANGHVTGFAVGLRHRF